MTKHLEATPELIAEMLEKTKATKAQIEATIEKHKKSENVSKPSIQYHLYQLQESLKAFSKGIEILERETTTNEERIQQGREIIALYGNVHGVVPEAHQNMTDGEFESLRGQLFKSGYVKGACYGLKEGAEAGFKLGREHGEKWMTNFLNALAKEGKLEIRDGRLDFNHNDDIVKRIFKESLKNG